MKQYCKYKIANIFRFTFFYSSLPLCKLQHQDIWKKVYSGYIIYMLYYIQALAFHILYAVKLEHDFI